MIKLTLGAGYFAVDAHPQMRHSKLGVILQVNLSFIHCKLLRQVITIDCTVIYLFQILDGQLHACFMWLILAFGVYQMATASLYWHPVKPRTFKAWDWSIPSGGVYRRSSLQLVVEICKTWRTIACLVTHSSFAADEVK